MSNENDVVFLQSDDDDTNESGGFADEREPIPGPSGVKKPRLEMTSDSTSTIPENKSNGAPAKEAKKQKAAEERAVKKMANDMNKIYKPGECMKYMTVEGHPLLWSSWWCSDVSREVTAAGAKVVTTPELCDPALVVWSRTVPRTIDKESGQLVLSPPEQQCGRALLVCGAAELVELVRAQALAPRARDLQALAAAALTLVVFGVKDYITAPRRKTLNSNRTPMTELQLELAITDLLVSANCDTVIVNTPNELALLIAQFTKAIAEEPYKRNKRACDEQAEFYMRGDSKKCVALDKNGIAVGKVWQQMIAMLPHSSLDTSRALCAQYKSPLALYEALQLPNSINEVADIGVCRAAVPGAKARRLGPEFARKLSILFTAEDGNTLVD